MDVNGLATSIELFLGSDVLVDNDGYRPVLWRGYVPGMDAYQGEVSEKDMVHELFRKKVKSAVASPDAMATQDWSGLDLVLDHSLGLLRDVTLPDLGTER
jgi:hypothetical protein